jgi:asparagine synthase (glutamine-hydrolysing)
MCGIAGWVGAAPPDALPAVLRALKHRGPDGDGAHVEPGAVLAMTRLAIIDLVTGQQPMANEDDTLRVIQNGEIYNYRALRDELQGLGHRFRTQSDTEVIVHGYEAWGERCAERFRGMFALAVWDTRRRRLFLARDRLGKKPLYYWHGAGLFAFASEVKALLALPAIGRALDAEAFHHYLAYGYTPADRSIFEGIRKLPPGHAATLEAGALRLVRYWDLPAPPADAPAVDFAEAARRVRAAVREAVALRLESDVPLGVFLSGGIDSSAVVAAMREATGGPIRTFTIGFGAATPTFDEAAYARAVARRFATDHHEEVLEPRVADLVPAIVDHFDEPFADSSAVPTWVVAQATARHVKVALSGIGGDETFAGYPRYLGVRVSEGYRRLPGPARRAAGALARVLFPESERSRNWADWARRFVEGSEQPLPGRYLAWTRFVGAADLAGLLAPAGRARCAGDPDAAHRAAFAGGDPADPRDGAFRADLACYLPDDLLVLADRMSMAHSLELRAPFCDHRLIELSLSLPPALKMRGLRLKALLKVAFADVLPPEVLAHRKQGFMIPLARWLRGDLRPLMDDLLAPARVRARGLFVPDAVEALRREHLGGRRSHADRLWTLMILEVWLRQHLDRGGLFTA